MQLEALRIGLAILGLFFASITDLRSREVPDWISYTLIIFGLGSNALSAVFQKSLMPIILAATATIILYACARLLFSLSHFGGGDAKLLIALGALFGNPPMQTQTALFFFNLPFLAIVLLNLLIIGSLYGMLYALVIAIQHARPFAKACAEQNAMPRFRKMKRLALIIAVPLALLTNLTPIPTMAKLFANAIILLILLYPHIQVIAKAIEISCLTKTIPLTKLTLGDWLAADIIHNRKVIARPSKQGVDEATLTALKKAHIRNVVVRYGIPFVPAFFLATLFTVMKPEIFLFAWP